MRLKGRRANRRTVGLSLEIRAIVTSPAIPAILVSFESHETLEIRQRGPGPDTNTPLALRDLMNNNRILHLPHLLVRTGPIPLMLTTHPSDSPREDRPPMRSLQVSQGRLPVTHTIRLRDNVSAYHILNTNCSRVHTAADPARKGLLRPP